MDTQETQRVTDQEPTRTGHGRYVDFTWDLQDLGEGVTEQLALSVGHSKDRKCFYATVRQQTYEKTPTATVVGFSVFDGVTLAREPVARFSQKALDAFAAKAVAALRATDDEKVAALLVPSDRSCGCTGQYHATGCEVYAASVR